MVGRSFINARFRRFTADPTPAERRGARREHDGSRERGSGGEGGGDDGEGRPPGAKVLKSLSQGASEMQGGCAV
jgi:hypothetical protein